ncbi:MAG: hypothetical protein QMD09_03210, partial [Desulfatibacillaceae bacterium]|nr:hypothetical protein [Desulfatibacillaceae bacterium]
HSLCQLSPKELSRTQTMAFLRFFLNPARMARIGRDYPGGWAALTTKTFNLFKHLFWTKTRRAAIH